MYAEIFGVILGHETREKVGEHEVPSKGTRRGSSSIPSMSSKLFTQTAAPSVLEPYYYGIRSKCRPFASPVALVAKDTADNVTLGS